MICRHALILLARTCLKNNQFLSFLKCLIYLFRPFENLNTKNIGNFCWCVFSPSQPPPSLSPHQCLITRCIASTTFRSSIASAGHQKGLEFHTTPGNAGVTKSPLDERILSKSGSVEVALDIFGSETESTQLKTTKPAGDELLIFVKS